MVLWDFTTMNVNFKDILRQLFKLTRCYKVFYKKLDKPLSDDELFSMVKRAVENVPFYSGHERYLTEPFSIKNLPFIRKSDIIGKEESFLSKNISRFLMQKVETGGSTGVSLELYYSIRTLILKDTVANKAFNEIGKNLTIGFLRGTKPANGGLCQIVNRHLSIFSSYMLSEDTLDEYLRIFKERHISCLHVYPSSLMILARLIKNKYGVADLPDLRGILSSSEIFSRDDKRFVSDVFPNVKLVDLYGHNECAVSAFSVNDGYYHFYSQFGYVEFMPTGEKSNGNNVAEIVATSIMNEDMPFIRYRTEDFVELDSNNNVVSIIGRTSDFVVTKDKKLAPCIISTRSKSMANVLNFQYYQKQEGKLVYRVVVNEKFNDSDITYLLEDMQSSFNNRVDCEVSIVKNIDRTKTGKQKRMIQELDINKYM